MGLHLLDWTAIEDKLSTAPATEKLILGSEDCFVELEDDYSSLPEISMEATDMYNGIRDALAPELLVLCDECFAPTFWNPVESDLEALESPAITSTARFSTIDVELGGGLLYIESLLSPKTLRAIAGQWETLPMDDIRSTTERAVEGIDWGWDDYIDSVDSWMQYLLDWNHVLSRASRDNLGMLIRA